MQLAWPRVRLASRPMNRYFRRLQQFGKRFSGKRTGALDIPPKVPPVTADRKKKTADKWNQ